MTMTHEISGRLPTRARARATALQNAVDVAQAGVTELSSKLRELRWNRQEVSNHLRVATDRRFSGGRDILSEGDVAGERQRLAALDVEIARLAALVEEQTAVHTPARALIGRVEAFLQGLRDGVISDHSAAPPSLKKGETFPDAIEARRRRVRELQAERAAVEAAPIPSTEAKRLAREQVERLAERGRPNVAPLLAGDEGFKFSTVLRLVKVAPAVGSVETIDVEAVISWLFRDQLIAAIEREIDAQSDDTLALDDRQRAARLEQIADELIAAEHEEAALVEMAAEQGFAIPHRPDIDVRALLGVEVTFAAAAA